MKEKKLIVDYMKKENLDLEEIINDYTPYIEKIIDNISLNSINKDDKEEIASDVFFIIWKNIHNLKKNKKISSYIAGVTRNLVKEYTRKSRATQDISNYENNLYIYDKIDSLDENIEEITKLEKKLGKMKEFDRTIFLEFYYSSKSIKDIAKEQNMSEFSIKQRLYRIRKKIKKEVR